MQALVNKKASLAVVDAGLCRPAAGVCFCRKDQCNWFDINRRHVEDLQQQAMKKAEIVLQMIPRCCPTQSSLSLLFPHPVDQVQYARSETFVKVHPGNGWKKARQRKLCGIQITPGCTEEDCLPVLEKYSGLLAEDF